MMRKSPGFGLGLWAAMLGVASPPAIGQIHDDAPRPTADPAWFANPTPVKMSGKSLPTCNAVSGDEKWAKKPCLDVDGGWANESKWKNNEKERIYIGWLVPKPLAPAYAGDTENLSVIKTNTVGSDNIGNHRANRYIAAHRYDLAMQQLNHVLKYWPSSYGAYARRGEIYRHFGKHDLAKADFDAALYWLEHSPVKDPYTGRHYEAPENLANALNYLSLRRAEYYIQEGKSAEAKAALDRVQTRDYTAKFYQPYYQKLLLTVESESRGITLAQQAETDKLLHWNLNCGEDPPVYAVAMKAEYRATDIALSYARMFNECGLKELSIQVLEPLVLAPMNTGKYPSEINHTNLMTLMSYYIDQGKQEELISRFKTAALSSLKANKYGESEQYHEIVMKLYEKDKKFSDAIEHIEDLFRKGDNKNYEGVAVSPYWAENTMLRLSKLSNYEQIPLTPRASDIVQRLKAKSAAEAEERRLAESLRKYQEERRVAAEQERAAWAAAAQAGSDERLAAADAILSQCFDPDKIRTDVRDLAKAWNNQSQCESARRTARSLSTSPHYVNMVFPWE